MHALQTVQDIEGNQRSLSEFANKVAVVVNVASQCGFTDSNYKGLQFLYDKYKDYDFTVRPLYFFFHLPNSASQVKTVPCFSANKGLFDDAVQLVMATVMFAHYRC